MVDFLGGLLTIVGRSGAKGAEAFKQELDKQQEERLRQIREAALLKRQKNLARFTSGLAEERAISAEKRQANRETALLERQRTLKQTPSPIIWTWKDKKTGKQMYAQASSAPNPDAIPAKYKEKGPDIFEKTLKLNKEARTQRKNYYESFMQGARILGIDKDVSQDFMSAIDTAQTPEELASIVDNKSGEITSILQKLLDKMKSDKPFVRATALRTFEDYKKWLGAKIVKEVKILPNGTKKETGNVVMRLSGGYEIPLAIIKSRKKKKKTGQQTPAVSNRNINNNKEINPLRYFGQNETRMNPRGLLQQWQ